MEMIVAKALDELANHLKWLHPPYTIDDVKPSKVRGYLEFTKPCPPQKDWPGHWRCGAEILPQNTPHYHTLGISGRPDMITGNYGRGRYAFWRAVCSGLNERKK